MFGTFGGQMGATAPFPATNYPAYSFFGAQSLQPTGAKAESSVTPQDKRTTAIMVILVVALGLGAFYVLHER